MRHIAFDPETLEGEDLAFFDAWVVKAQQAEQALATPAAGTELDFDETVWSSLKSWLFRHVFAGKCAYCEMKLLAGFYGAADHHRPKKSVRERSPTNRRFVKVVPHHGYYWLAYTWWNLLPTCDKCNAGKGKRDKFPIAAVRVFEKAELTDASAREELNTREAPLLLHPYDDDPSEHLVFGGGLVEARHGSTRGTETIIVCDLNREDLVDARRERQKVIRMALKGQIAQWAWTDEEFRTSPFWTDFEQEYLAPDKEYSAAMTEAAEDLLREKGFSA